MEFLRSHPSGTTSRRRHNHQDTHTHRTRNGQARDRKENWDTGQRRPADIIMHHGALGKGPVPRSKEKNDEFVQSWLQQTQSRQSRPSAIGYGREHERERVQLTEQSLLGTRRNNHGKRPRSLPESPPPPSGAEYVEYRFEKRARHKIRDDKYDYKALAMKKRVLDQKSRKHIPREAIGERSQVARRKSSVSSNLRTNAVARR
jgi:hypothetical protein